MNNKVDFITIIVCTYNRADMLKECLTALFNQTAPQECYEVLVVDNNSTDQTKNVVENFQKKHKNLRYYLEKKQGLSHARNAGYKNSDAQWVGYMDDDGKPHLDYIEKTFEVINNYDFDCFGGRYLAWYKTPKPKWLNSNFGESKTLRENIGELKKFHNSGGIIFFLKEKLSKVEGFPPNLGMNGGKIAYGEEILVQNEFRKRGWKIGYSPFIKMEHLVAEQKLKIPWHIKAYYAHGRDNINLWKNSQTITFWTFIKLTLFKFRKSLSDGVRKLIKNKDYYIQNLVLDICQPIAYLYGNYLGQRKKKNK